MARMEDLLAALPGVLWALGGTAVDKAPPVSEIGILGTDDDPLCHPGELVLGVGLAGDEQPLVQKLADAGAAGVVLRWHGNDAPQLASAPLPVLGAPRDARWARLHALLLGAMQRLAGDPDDEGDGSLFGLANALAAATGGSVLIQDPRWRVLAYSAEGPTDEVRRNTILGRAPADEIAARLRDSGFAAEMMAAREPLLMPTSLSGGDYDRLVVAVRAGIEVLGYITLIPDDPANVAQHALTMSRAAGSTALAMLRVRATEGERRHARAALVRDVLAGAPGMTGAAAELGWEPARGHVAVAVRVAADDEVTAAAQRNRLQGALSLAMASLHPLSEVVEDGGALYLAMPVPPGWDTAEVRAAVGRVFGGLPGSLTAGVLAGMGPLAASLEELPSSRRGADLTVGALATQGSSSTGMVLAALGDVIDDVLLAQAADALGGVELLAEGPLGVLRAADARDGTDFAATVDAWLGCLGDLQMTARQLGIHRNTVRHRLRRIEQELGVALGERRTRELLSLQLRVKPR